MMPSLGAVSPADEQAEDTSEVETTITARNHILDVFLNGNRLGLLY